MVDGGPDEAGAELACEQRRRARLAAELHDEGVELLEDDDGRVLVDGEPCPSPGLSWGFPCWWSPPGGSTSKGNRSNGRDRWVLPRCSTLEVAY